MEQNTTLEPGVVVHACNSSDLQGEGRSFRFKASVTISKQECVTVGVPSVAPDSVALSLWVLPEGG
jgi:hypothetical protein